MVRKLLNFIIVLLILDVITTSIALNFGTEQNLILVWLSQYFNLQIIWIVYVTHILAVLIILGLRYLYNTNKINFDKVSYYIVCSVIVLYCFIVANNLVQLLKII